MTKDEIIASSGRTLARVKSGTLWVDLKMHSVRRAGEAAILLHRAELQWCDLSGAEHSLKERYRHTWWRTDQGWQIIGGMSAPL